MLNSKIKYTKFTPLRVHGCRIGRIPQYSPVCLSDLS